jgi:hypothetical protein
MERLATAHRLATLRFSLRHSRAWADRTVPSAKSLTTASWNGSALSRARFRAGAPRPCCRREARSATSRRTSSFTIGRPTPAPSRRAADAHNGPRVPACPIAYQQSRHPRRSTCLVVYRSHTASNLPRRTVRSPVAASAVSEGSPPNVPDAPFGRRAPAGSASQIRNLLRTRRASREWGNRGSRDLPSCCRARVVGDARVADCVRKRPQGRIVRARSGGCFASRAAASTRSITLPKPSAS